MALLRFRPAQCSASLALVTLLGACAGDATSPSTPDEMLAAASVAATAASGRVQSGVEIWPQLGDWAIPCGPDGAISDVVRLSGEVHFRWTAVMDAAGKWHMRDISVMHDASAVSLTTGLVYQVPQTNKVNGQSSWDAEVGSNVMRLRYIAPGPANDFTIESHSVWNFLSDGTVRVWFSDYTLVCHTDGENVPGSNHPAEPIHEWPDA